MTGLIYSYMADKYGEVVLAVFVDIVAEIAVLVEADCVILYEVVLLVAFEVILSVAQDNVADKSKYLLATVVVVVSAVIGAAAENVCADFVVAVADINIGNELVDALSNLADENHDM